MQHTQVALQRCGSGVARHAHGRAKDSPRPFGNQVREHLHQETRHPSKAKAGFFPDCAPWGRRVPRGCIGTAAGSTPGASRLVQVVVATALIPSRRGVDHGQSGGPETWRTDARPRRSAVRGATQWRGSSPHASTRLPAGFPNGSKRARACLPSMSFAGAAWPHLVVHAGAEQPGHSHQVTCAPLAELVDATDSKSVTRPGVPVRIRGGALIPPWCKRRARQTLVL